MEFARSRGTATQSAALKGTAAAWLLVACGCTSQMQVLTHHARAEVLVDGEPRGAGKTVTLEESGGLARDYRIEARVNPSCREHVTVSTRQNKGRMLGCMVVVGVIGLASIAVTAAVALSTDPTAGSSGLGLSGVATSISTASGLLLCALGSHEAPQTVDLDLSHCRDERADPSDR